MDNGAEKDATRRVIKRYSNRKLYDTRDSRYVTLLQIAEMVRGGEDVQIIDNTTKEDKTEVTLALAISEELKTRPRAVSVGSLRTLIQERGEKLLTSLRDGPIGRLIPAPGAPEGAKPEENPEEVEASSDQAAAAKAGAPEGSPQKHEGRSGLAELLATSTHTIHQWQQAMDERIRAVIPGLKEHMDLQAEVRRLAQRVEALEAHVGVTAKVAAVEMADHGPAAIDTSPRAEVAGASEGGLSGGGGSVRDVEMRAEGHNQE
ncbi:MAG: polyhydroxyalkanoate synthesis regulator DNA-binding domain-containing protein [Deltaproteobacteria bacterium]|nr:polyhydroxyalkanoate synthesis regulator DNA-binding domain-containing protein [Deltaproteobacteria bacterium]